MGSRGAGRGRGVPFFAIYLVEFNVFLLQFSPGDVFVIVFV
jgi:hypothetical protein